jgi:hypothetical protein
MASIKALNTISNSSHFEFETNLEASEETVSDVNRQGLDETANRQEKATLRPEAESGSQQLPQASAEG